jgi:putative aldouronate transport system substrate-binding protein
MDMPRTLDSYLNYLIAVRDEDANGNGDSTDEVPLTSYVGLSHNIYRAIGNAFQYTDASTYLKVNNGIVSFVAKNDAFKQTAEYIKMLVDENLLDPAGFTQDAASLQARSLDATIMGSFAVGNSSSMVDTSSPQYLGLIFMPPLEGPAGYRATPMNMPRVNRCMVITTSCKTPDVAFRLCDFMLTEEAGTACRIGHEGVEWKVAAQGELGRNGEQAKYKLLKPQEWIQPKTDAIWGIENINFGNTMNFVAEEPNSPISVQVKSLLEGDALNFNTGEQLPELLMSIEDAAEYNDIKTLIVNYINENLALFALGDRSMSEWDVFINEFKAMGSDRYVELAQAAYDNLTD